MLYLVPLIRAAFNSFDKDGDGQLTEAEFFEIGKTMNPGTQWTRDMSNESVIVTKPLFAH